MSNVKIVYFESIDIEARLRNRFPQNYKIAPGLYLIRFEGTAQDIFDSLCDKGVEEHIFVHDLDSCEDSYWGYMNKDLWTWLAEKEDKDTSSSRLTDL